ncbi:hypothetical protein [Rarobacter incanus]|uniref:hypothetical protein n=1 Tax=Rarobacter incanus TaxID=153494 RepID=UPI00114FB3E2|nr:hypothetical protein [Rarobacter incanus]
MKLRKVEATISPAHGGRSSKHVKRHQTKFDSSLMRVAGVSTTDIARVVIDVSRTESFACGLAAADYALRMMMVSRDELGKLVFALSGARGIRKARKVITCADPRSESVGESLSRARFIEHRIGIPRLQEVIRLRNGKAYRVDFYWPDQRIIGEFDGFQKYVDSQAPSIDHQIAVQEQERVRHNQLHRAGYTIVRWTWKEALEFTTLPTLLAEAGVPMARTR